MMRKDLEEKAKPLDKTMLQTVVLTEILCFGS